MPTANRNTEVSRVVSWDSQQKHILRVIVARTRRYLNNLLAGNLDWIIYFYLSIFLTFQLYLFIFLAQKRLEHAATELVNGSWPCARRFNHELLSVSVSFFNHSSSSFLDTCAYSQDSFFSFTIGIFPFLPFAIHSLVLNADNVTLNKLIDCKNDSYQTKMTRIQFCP